MRTKQSSMTATGIVIMRAIESARPEAERICFDPYARQMVNPGLFHLANFMDKLGYMELRGPGVLGFLAGRERHIDEYLQGCLADGLSQLVILGAGFDARAYRFETLKQGIPVFEVDHPATQQVKLIKLKQIFGRLPEHVVYVPIDFSSQTLAEALGAAGYDERLKTLFIWQGVTQYLSPEAVDATLAFIVEHSGPGSSVIFDYMYTALLDGSMKHGEVSKLRQDRWISGESLSFGIPEGTIEAFVEGRGFTCIQNANCAALQQAYFTGAAAKRKLADGYAIVSAVVKHKAG